MLLPAIAPACVAELIFQVPRSALGLIAGEVKHRSRSGIALARNLDDRPALSGRHRDRRHLLGKPQLLFEVGAVGAIEGGGEFADFLDKPEEGLRRAAGAVDFVLAPDQIPVVLTRLLAQLDLNRCKARWEAPFLSAGLLDSAT